MMRLPMSNAAAGMFRALLTRSGAPRDRILLINVESRDWQSFTFTGERHVFDLRLIGPDAATVALRLCDGIEDAEFAIPGHIVAEISATPTPDRGDGSIHLSIEALTIRD